MQMIEVQSYIISVVCELMAMLASAPKKHSGYVQATHKFRSLKSSFYNWQPECFQFIKEIRALIHKETGEEINNSDFYFDAGLFNVNSNKGKENIAEDIAKFTDILENYFSSVFNIDSIINDRFNKLPKYKVSLDNVNLI